MSECDPVDFPVYLFDPCLCGANLPLFLSFHLSPSSLQVVGSLRCWELRVTYTLGIGAQCMRPSSQPALSCHGHSHPWRLPSHHRPSQGEEEEGGGQGEEELSMPAVWESLQQRGEAEGALVLAHWRATVQLYAHRLHQGLCVQVQAVTVRLEGLIYLVYSTSLSTYRLGCWHTRYRVVEHCQRFLHWRHSLARFFYPEK